tara:strand:+ start:427 stop:822 length:396 start_codon:yes stop_codon:yes gene_type:complete
MASLNQSFTKFDKDTFLIRFVISDTQVNLSSYYAWWGVSTTVGSNPLIEKATGGWTTGASGTGLTMGSNYADITMTQADFNGNGVTGKLDVGNYYHELVIAQSSNASDSVVVANGTFNVNESLFTNEDYRW